MSMTAGQHTRNHLYENFNVHRTAKVDIKRLYLNRYPDKDEPRKFMLLHPAPSFQKSLRFIVILHEFEVGGEKRPAFAAGDHPVDVNTRLGWGGAWELHHVNRDPG